MMKIFVLGNTRIPTEKAHGWQIMKMCESLADVLGKNGEVFLVAPKRVNKAFGMNGKFNSDIAFKYYGITANFKIEYLDVEDRLGKAKSRLAQFFAVYRDSKTFARQAFKYINEYMKKIAEAEPTAKPIIISRDHRVLCFLKVLYFFDRIKFNQNLFYEMHDFPENALKRIVYKGFLKRLSGIIVTNEWKKNELERNFGIPESKILLTRHGVDSNEYGKYDREMKAGGHRSGAETDKEAREAAGFGSIKGKIAVYTGSLYDWKGVGTIIAAARLAKDINFVIIGGSKAEWENLAEKAGGVPQNVFWKEVQPKKEVIKYQYAADVLLVTNMPGTVQSERATSPLKVFEYAAAHKPIAVSDLPSMRDVLRDEDAFFFRAGDAEDLSRAVQKACSDKPEDKADAERKATNAYSKIMDPLGASGVLSWEKRAQKIIDFLKEHSGKNSEI